MGNAIRFILGVGVFAFAFVFLGPLDPTDIALYPLAIWLMFPGAPNMLLGKK